MAFEGFTQGLTSLRDILSNILTNILNAISNLVTDLLNGLKNLFVPKEDFFSEKVQEFKSHFAFIDTFTGFVNNFTSMNSNTTKKTRGNEAPSITIDFSNAESQYNYGGKAVALSLSWYSRYKPIADVVITAFVYGFFIWQFYCRLPEIIRGYGIAVDRSSRIEKYTSSKERK